MSRLSSNYSQAFARSPSRTTTHKQKTTNHQLLGIGAFGSGASLVGILNVETSSRPAIGATTHKFVCLSKKRLTVALRRLPIERMLKLSSRCRSFEIASQNFTIRSFATVEFLVGVLIRAERRAFQRDARE